MRRLDMIHLFVFAFCVQIAGQPDKTQDITTSRPNTLYDNADDIQRQLDNEARDRLKFGRPKTVWVFHLPTHLPEVTTVGLQRYSRGINLFQNIKRKGKSGFKEFLNKVDLVPEWDYNKCYYLLAVKMTVSHKLNHIECMIIVLLTGEGALQVLRLVWGQTQRNPYRSQNTWHKTFPDCGGKSQSPVNLPNQSLIKAKGGRKLVFINYDVQPKSLTLTNDGQRVILTGQWEPGRQPLITGGAAHSRRYLFHSLTYHWPSEHSISGLIYPMESQVLHISADYKTFDEAVRESRHDPLAFLGIVNIYTFSNITQSGVLDILKAAASVKCNEESMPVSPLSHFNPPFKVHVIYQGSLTAPPCTESVLWIIRAKSLPIVREVVDAAKYLFIPRCDPKPLLSRQIQPLNDRKVYLFH